jgi:hypothetical protein
MYLITTLCVPGDNTAAAEHFIVRVSGNYENTTHDGNSFKFV